MANCYSCRFCAYKPQEYGKTGICVKDHFDGLPLEPLNATYAEWEEPLGGFPSFADRCPDFEVGERQMLCKAIADKAAQIAELKAEVEKMIEGVQDFDYQNQKYFEDTDLRFFWVERYTLPL